MTNSDRKLYLSKLQIIGPVILIPPMIFFGAMSAQAYKRNTPVFIILGVGALLFLVMLIEQIRFLYFLITKRPAIVLTENCLIDNLNSKELPWPEIEKIAFVSNGFNTPGKHILVTSKKSERSISVRNRLVNSNADKTIKSDEILNLLIHFHEKYRNQPEFPVSF